MPAGQYWRSQWKKHWMQLEELAFFLASQRLAHLTMFECWKPIISFSAAIDTFSKNLLASVIIVLLFYYCTVSIWIQLNVNFNSLINFISSWGVEYLSLVSKVTKKIEMFFTPWGELCRMALQFFLAFGHSIDALSPYLWHCCMLHLLLLAAKLCAIVCSLPTDYRIW